METKLIQEVAEDIFCIKVPIINNPLKVINSYLIKGKEKDCLIDTGFRLPECREALMKGLAQLHSTPERRIMILTHMHADHTGLSAELMDENGIAYMSEPDRQYLSQILDNQIFPVMETRFFQEGMPMEIISYHGKNSASRTRLLDRLDNRYQVLKNGEKVRIGRYELEAIYMPGHTPGNMMLWEANHQLMFTGDHVLFDITPNITAFVGVKDALGDYLQSLKKAKQYPVRMAFPGHRESGDYQGTIRRIEKHHHARLEEVLRIVTGEPMLNAFEITQRMQWKVHSPDGKLPMEQAWFAMGECLSHLDYLCVRNQLQRTEQQGKWIYKRYE